MRFVVFGLSVSSSWGNGHATLWRGLCRSLAARGHHVTFFERDVPYYAEHRDLTTLESHTLVLYGDWHDVQPAIRRALDEADVGIVTSFCPDGPAACERVLDAKLPVAAFYDLDTPVTIARLRARETVPYLPPHGLSDFDLVLSYTGGRALSELESRLGARRVVPLYGSVDPHVHRPQPARAEFRCDLSYLATYAADRQDGVERLLLRVARRRPRQRFLIGGSQYPDGFGWTPNLSYVDHVPPGVHASFYGSSRATLSVTRGAMAVMGYCPSGRLFEAASCGVPIVSDAWEGLDRFFAFGEEILPASTTDDVIGALALSDAELQRIGRSGRARALDCHTADVRARELEAAVIAAARPGTHDAVRQAPTRICSSLS